MKSCHSFRIQEHFRSETHIRPHVPHVCTGKGLKPDKARCSVGRSPFQGSLLMRALAMIQKSIHGVSQVDLVRSHIMKSSEIPRLHKRHKDTWNSPGLASLHPPSASLPNGHDQNSSVFSGAGSGDPIERRRVIPDFKAIGLIKSRVQHWNPCRSETSDFRHCNPAALTAALHSITNDLQIVPKWCSMKYDRTTASPKYRTPMKSISLSIGRLHREDCGGTREPGDRVETSTETSTAASMPNMKRKEFPCNCAGRCMACSRPYDCPCDCRGSSGREKALVTGEK